MGRIGSGQNSSFGDASPSVFLSSFLPFFTCKIRVICFSIPLHSFFFSFKEVASAKHMQTHTVARTNRTEVESYASTQFLKKASVENKQHKFGDRRSPVFAAPLFKVKKSPVDARSEPAQ